MSRDQQFILFGAALALLAVALGAFGAHALKSVLTEDRLRWFQTAAQYHAIQAPGLILIGLCLKLYGPQSLLVYAGFCLLGGIVLFSGSLYLMAVYGLRGLGAVTPVGGVLLISGWALFAVGIYRAG